MRLEILCKSYYVHNLAVRDEHAQALRNPGRDGEVSRNYCTLATFQHILFQVLALSIVILVHYLLTRDTPRSLNAASQP